VVSDYNLVKVEIFHYICSCNCQLPVAQTLRLEDTLDGATNFRDLVHSEEAQELEATMMMSPTVYGNLKSNGTTTTRFHVCMSGLIFYIAASEVNVVIETTVFRVLLLSSTFAIKCIEYCWYYDHYVNAHCLVLMMHLFAR
jgi:hypothetical protein